jgi:hypothetical protein
MYKVYRWRPAQNNGNNSPDSGSGEQWAKMKLSVGGQYVVKDTKNPIIIIILKYDF